MSSETWVLCRGLDGTGDEAVDVERRYRFYYVAIYFLGRVGEGKSRERLNLLGLCCLAGLEFTWNLSFGVMLTSFPTPMTRTWGVDCYIVTTWI